MLDCAWGLKRTTRPKSSATALNYFHIENLPPSHIAIRLCLTAAGLYGRGQRNARQIELRQHDVISARLPDAFDGYTLLQLSDLHVEMSEGAMTRLAAMLPDIDYDLCVLTGDYRAQTFGAYQPALAGWRRTRCLLSRRKETYAGPSRRLV
jgi:uncharacterized protein